MNEERLQKFLASAGIASRRKCEEFILDGKVEVNGANIKQTTNEVVNKSNAIEAKIKNSQVFKNITDKIDSSYINSFLQGKGESDLHREYIESMKLEMNQKQAQENKQKNM